MIRNKVIRDEDIFLSDSIKKIYNKDLNEIKIYKKITNLFQKRYDYSIHLFIPFLRNIFICAFSRNGFNNNKENSILRVIADLLIFAIKQ